MIVAVDAMALGSGRGGDETYTRGLLTGLAEIVPEDGADCFPLLVRPGAPLPAAVQRRAAFPLLPVAGRSSVVRHAVTVRRVVSRFRPRVELLHSLVHAPPWPPRPVALYLPDVAYLQVPELHPPRVRLRLTLLVALHVRQARAIITLSEHSRRDILRAYRVNPEGVFVVPTPVSVKAHRPDTGSEGDPSLDDAGFTVWLQQHGITGPYFLYVGNLHPQKNVARLVQAFVRARRAAPALAAHQLVIAGARWWGAGPEERAAAEAAPGSIVFLGRVSDEERDRLLAGAVALAYPSLYEGFGLPPVEAMAAGTPVLASNVTSLPEVLGDAALLVDPLDVDAIAAGLVKLAADPALRQDLRERGARRAARYTPRATAEAAMEAFRWALAERRTVRGG
jgi:glycosyltransferase involved in cell wall biosynthesis